MISISFAAQPVATPRIVRAVTGTAPVSGRS